MCLQNYDCGDLYGPYVHDTSGGHSGSAGSVGYSPRNRVSMPVSCGHCLRAWAQSHCWRDVSVDSGGGAMAVMVPDPRVGDYPGMCDYDPPEPSNPSLVSSDQWVARSYQPICNRETL
jgi:hypothetical protein